MSLLSAPLRGIKHGRGGVSYSFNVSPRTTANFRNAWKAQNANVIVAFHGDSTQRGLDPTAAVQNQQYPNSAAIKASAKLNAMGIPTSASNFFGYGGGSAVIATLKTNDSRFDYTGTSVLNGNVSVGGNGFDVPASSTISFTPTELVNKADIYWRDFTTGRNWTWAVDGGGATTVLSTTAGTIQKTSISLGAVGTHTITLGQALGTPGFYGIHAYNDTRWELQLHNYSVSGGGSGNMINNGSAPSGGNLRFISLFPAKLAIIEGGIINDWRASVSVATSKANLTTLVQAYKAAGSDVILWVPPFDGSGTGLVANQNAYVTAMYEVATEQDVGLVDIRKRAGWTSYAEEVSSGNVGDTVHPTITTGYLDQSIVISQTIKNILKN